MMKSKISIILCLIFVAVFGQNAMRYRTISSLQKGWNYVMLPDSIFQFSNGNYSQFRVKTNNQTEIPYYIKSVPTTNFSETTQVRILNKSHQNNRYFFTIENVKESNNYLKINALHLNFSETNYDRKLSIEGSNDNISWFTLATNARIASFVNQQENFTASSVFFPESNYHFYRISFESDVIPELTSAEIFQKMDTKNEEFILVKPKFQQIIKDKTTKITIHFLEFIALGKVQFVVNEDIKFSRNITIEAMAENANQSKENYQKKILFEGNFNHQNFLSNFPEVWCNKILISIYNEDNIPLTINNLQLGKYQHFLYFQTDKQYNSLQLLYDYDLPLSQPSYDIVSLENIEINSQKAKLSNENLLAKNEEKSSNYSQYFLWIMLGLVCVLLAFFTFRMLQKTD